MRYETPRRSTVIEVPEEDLRLLHLSHLMFTTSPRSPMRKPVAPTFTLTSVAAFMAMVHFNQRNEVVVPGLKNRLEGCDLYLTMDMLDSQISPIVASHQIFEAMSRNHSLATPRPGSVVGSFSSSVTLPVAVLTSAGQIPHVGGVSSTHVFDNKDQYPTFARTVPASDGYAAATIELLQHLNVSHVGLMHSLSEYGKSYFAFFQRLAMKAGITIVGASYEAREPEEMRSALEIIKSSGFRYIIAVGDASSTDVLLEIAYESGIAGPGFQWITTSLSPFEVQEYEAARTSLVTAYNGLLSVELEMPQNRRFFGSVIGFLQDPELTSFFVDSHPESFIWDNYAFNETPPAIIRFANTHYDAVMAVGISACETTATSFTGLEHYDQLKNTTFSGASGDIEFDSITGTRKLGNLRYAWTSYLIDDELSTNETVVFTPQNPVTIDFALGDPIIVNTAITFSDNKTTAPSPLPPVGEIHQNLIPAGIIIFGWVLAGVLVTLSLGFATYTYWKRQKALIRASQPIFLGMLCLGTLLMASTIVPLSLQEPVPKEDLDIACMSVPWLYTIGFSTAFSSLFTKAWRINRVVRNSVELQRVQVHARDVIWPFVLLTMTNVAILVTWTIIEPLQWTRNYSSKDQYGRGVETFGTCSFAAGSSRVFLLLLAIFNGLVVVFANYQSYIGRNNPTEFNESSHVAISMASLLECFLVGGPILILVDKSPVADFSVKTILIFVSCCAILLPMFIPKFSAQPGPRRTIDDMHRSMRRLSTTSRTRRARRQGSGVKKCSSDGEDEVLLHRKLEYLKWYRSSQGGSNNNSEIFEEEPYYLRASRSSQGSYDSGLASSVQELRKNALRSRSMVVTANMA